MRIKFPLFILAALMLTVPLWAQDGSKATIVGSDHDFVTNGNVGTLCGVCHIPHQSDGVNHTLLWNHYVDGTATYTAYSSATLQASVGAMAQADTAAEEFYSLACLGCHDGTTAINVVYRLPQGASSLNTTSPYLLNFGGADTAYTITNVMDTYIGTDLSNDHPVNFTYDSTLATNDGGLYTPATPNASGPGYVRTWAGTGAVTVPVLFNNTVQCATCHNPHNNSTIPYLRMGTGGTTGADNLCLACHSTT